MLLASAVMRAAGVESRSNGKESVAAVADATTIRVFVALVYPLFVLALSLGSSEAGADAKVWRRGNRRAAGGWGVLCFIRSTAGTLVAWLQATIWARSNRRESVN